MIIGLALFARGDGSATVRLGNVVYWAATGIAGLTIVFAIFDIVAGRPEANSNYYVGLIAAAVWLVGRACLYILTGR